MYIHITLARFLKRSDGTRQPLNQSQQTQAGDGVGCKNVL